MDTSLGADPRPWPFCPQSGGSSSLVIPLWEQEGHQDSPDEPEEVPAGPLALHWSEGLEGKAGKEDWVLLCVSSWHLLFGQVGGLFTAGRWEESGNKEGFPSFSLPVEEAPIAMGPRRL